MQTRTHNPSDTNQSHGGWVELVILKGTGLHPLLGWPAINRLNLELKRDHLLVTGEQPWTLPLLTSAEVSQHDDDMRACHSMHLSSVAGMRDAFERDLATNSGEQGEDPQSAVFDSGPILQRNR
jgi:hypothetical protein